ncbi:MAG TPA: hypothetical protein VKT49_15245 [Bryobacteraceae bacterium]|nr:hypothetical protein [Bryobacteraceae bacterium]
MFRDAFLSGQRPAAFEHLLAKIQAVDYEIGCSGIPQLASHSDFGIAITRPDTQKAALTFTVFVGALEIPEKKILGAGITEAGQLRKDETVQPVKADGREIMDTRLVVKVPALGRDTRRIGGIGRGPLRFIHAALQRVSGLIA